VNRVAALLAPAAALLLAACAGAPPVAPPVAPPGEPGTVVPGTGGDEAIPPPGAAPFATIANRFAARAARQEAAGDLRRALDSWKVVGALQPEATEAKRKVDDLTTRLKTEAERRFRDGNARLQEGNVDAARRELLLSLAANPDHAGSLSALKTRFEQDATPYTVAAGDTFESIAKKQYGDPAKSPLVARANNLDPTGKPVPGTVLALPNLSPLGAKPALKRVPGAVADTPEARDSGDDTEPDAIGTEGYPPTEPARERDSAEALLENARELFQAKKFEAAGSAADKLAGNPALAARARELSGNAWFAAGNAALKQDRFADAVAAYRKAEPTRKDIPTALAAVERRKMEKAEELYNEGVRFFINQKLDKAILKWEQTLALNPEHAKAPKDIVKARELQQKLKELR